MGCREHVPAKATVLVKEQSPNLAPSTTSMWLEHDGKMDRG